jgi:hypothetical protein
MRGNRILMVPHDVPVARAMSKEIRNDNVGNSCGSIPSTIHAAKRRSAPTAFIVPPDAQASVNTTKARKIRVIPKRKDSTHSGTDIRNRGWTST